MSDKNKLESIFDEITEIIAKDDPKYLGMSLIQKRFRSAQMNIALLERSIEGCQLKLKMNPLIVEVLCDKGKFLAQQGSTWLYFDKYQEALPKYQDAIEAYNEVIKIEPDNALASQNIPTIYGILGFIFRNLGRHQEALEAYDEVLKIHPKNFTVLFNKGKSLYKLGKLKEALNINDKALEISPNDVRALENKKFILDKIHRYFGVKENENIKNINYQSRDRKNGDSYFKIFFDEGGNDNALYYIEEEYVNSYLELIPLLIQGYIRCLNNLKKTFGHDKESSEFLLSFVERILMLSNRNIDLIRDYFNESDSFNVLNFIIDKDTENMGDEAFLHKIFSSFSETKNKNEIVANVNIKYEIKIGQNGNAVMYDVSFRINNFIQVQSYIRMLAHLLPRLNNFKMFLFFLSYMIEIDKEIIKNDYTSAFGMANIIKNSSNNFREIVNVWISQDDNDDFSDLELCIPEY